MTSRFWRRLFLSAGVIVVLGYAVGFAVFASKLSVAVVPPPQGAADAIVALTGNGDRLGPALSLLEHGAAKRMLISGVNKLTTKPHLKFLLHGGDRFDCCVDLGFAAEDTRGNATEAARWAGARDYHSLIVVTAAYHMPRSLVEFSAAMPGMKLIPYPVAGEAPGSTPWQNLIGLQGEYVKYLASLARLSFSAGERAA